VAAGLIGVLAADPVALAAAVLADLAIGDPVHRLHPVRLIGFTISVAERWLRRIGADGYGGGVALAAIVGACWTSLVGVMVLAGSAATPWLGWFLHVLLLTSLLALGDLVRHVWRVEEAASGGDLARARTAVGALVGRDTAPLDEAGCRRAAIESLSESLTDGFTSALFWYAIGGLPGLALFKVVSTLDSMVGYRTPRYLRFGWCGARMDDLMNYLPARLTWLLIAATALVVPGCSAGKALTIGRAQHALLPGPNSGWSEAATAGGISRRLVGPVWNHGALVTDTWIGDPADPPAGTRGDVVRAIGLVVGAGVFGAVVTMACLFASRG
jgi:adenosylcobinamide-phosphate synthase